MGFYRVYLPVGDDINISDPWCVHFYTSYWIFQLIHFLMSILDSRCRSNICSNYSLKFSYHKNASMKFLFWFSDFEYFPWIVGHYHWPTCKRHRWVHHRGGRDKNIHFDELDLMEVDKRSLFWSQNLVRVQLNMFAWQNFNCSLICSFVRSFLLFSFEK